MSVEGGGVWEIRNTTEHNYSSILPQLKIRVGTHPSSHKCVRPKYPFLLESIRMLPSHLMYDPMTYMYNTIII